MNVERILRVADAIERHELPNLGFNMGTFKSSSGRRADLSGHSCGTVACIAGWTAELYQAEYEDDSAVRGSADVLDLDSDSAFRLFCPAGWISDPERYPLSAAVSVLRHLAVTGEVDWQRALSEPVSP